MQLMAQRTFPNDELSGVGPVQAVDAIRSCYPFLNPQVTRITGSIAKDPSQGYNIFCDGFQSANDILVGAGYQKLKYQTIK